MDYEIAPHSGDPACGFDIFGGVTAILREIVEQAKSLNLLDSASYYACKYEKLIQVLLGYVRDTFPDIHKPRVSRSTKSSRSKSTDNTKNDRILQILSRTQKKNKVEDHSRIVKTCLNKLNCVVEPSGSAHVQHSKLNTNSELILLRKLKRKKWKPTGKMFTKIGYNWTPTGRTFALVGNACPLTRIIATNKVPLREPIPLEVVAQESVVTKVYTRRPKIVKVFGRPMLKSHTGDRSPIVHKYLGSLEPPIYISIGDIDGVISNLSLVQSLKDQIMVMAPTIVTFEFGAINHLAKNGLVRGLPKLKFEKDHLCSACTMGKSKKQSHKPKSEDTN
ncbi:hypothetical protein Tco_0266285 [Tanacetum coccineum]